MASKVCLDKTSSTFERNVIVSVSRTYNMYEYATRELAEAAMLAAAPNPDPTYATLTLRSASVKESEAVDYWTGEVTWEDRTPRGPADEEEPAANDVFTGGISLATMKIIHTLEHVSSTNDGNPFGGAPLDAGGLIGRQGEETVDGVDTVFPTFTFSIQRDYNKGTYDLEYMAMAMAYCGRPNLTQWGPFAEWEVMLVSVDGTSDAGADFDTITHNFEAKPSFVGLQIPGPAGQPITVNVKGFEHLWIEYTPSPQDEDGVVRQLVNTVHVDRIHHGCELNDYLPLTGPTPPLVN